MQGAANWIFSLVVHTKRTVQLVALSIIAPLVLSQEEAAAIPALQEVFKTLQAHGKYDIDLIDYPKM